MNIFVRSIICAAVLIALYCFFYWFPFSFFPFGKITWGSEVLALLCAATISFILWGVLKKKDPGPVSYTFSGAVLFGTLGFSAGFFGPLIFVPEANQGPLLGLFITGPLGFIAGGIAGLVYWSARVRKGNV